MSDLRLAFFGSPEFALPTLQALIDSPYRPLVVITQPDRPAGRGRAVRLPPIKQLAEAAGIAVLQPARLRDPEATAALTAFQPELQVIAAYGQILRPDVLALPRHGTLNVHASLLPRWRGASPVAAAIRTGDEETGVTIMLVDEGEDSGDILAARREPIRDDDDAASLEDRLAQLGASLLLETIPPWIEGAIKPLPQDADAVTRAPRLKKAAGRIDWAAPADAIWRQVRAFSPWPGATTFLGRRAIRIWEAAPATESEADDGRPPGTILALGETIAVQTGRGVLQLQRLQREGKRAMGAAEFARGERDLLAQRLGAPDA